ncbi:hypothetical protein DM02DRAFT_127237 [Periconia macrospinosa]|uniref:F-box domain-containing protein n=1 Tax=Periconia macrospinosa TaxID=97972 RepID=A0A2V1E4P3_9PLEO|nr:hypothetical protein DM02DRAFT_127237 [Periconia macrospinosa]
MSFTTLPTELKLEIMGYLDPTSCFNIAISCKEHWDTFRSLVETHSRLISENNPFHVGAISDSRIFEIIDSPRLGWYVRDCILEHSEYGDQNDTVENFDLDDLYVPNRETANFEAEKARLNNDYSKWMKNERLHGKPIAYQGREIITLVTVLMHHLPFLTTLSISSGSSFRFLIDAVEEDEMPFLNFMHVLAKAYIQSSSAQQIRDLPFSHLTTVAIARGDYLFTRTDWCSHFLYIPTLRNFVGRRLAGTYDCHENEFVKKPAEPSWDEDTKLEKYNLEFAHPLYKEAPYSKVEELLFLEAKVDMFVLNDILSRTPSLRRFSYQANDVLYESEAKAFAYCPKKIFLSLLKHTSQSLEQLTLEDPGGLAVSIRLCYPMPGHALTLIEHQKRTRQRNA